MYIVGMLGPGVHYLFLYWAQAEDERTTEKDKSLSGDIVLVNRKISFGHNGLRGWAEDKCILS